jgi:hypothetical protein
MAPVFGAQVIGRDNTGRFEMMAPPGLGLFARVNEVGLSVKQATGGRQPRLPSSPIEDGFNFASGPQPTAAATPAPAPVTGETVQRGEPVPRTESPAPTPVDAHQQRAPPASPPTTGQQQTVALSSQQAPPASLCRDRDHRRRLVGRFDARSFTIGNQASWITCAATIAEVVAIPIAANSRALGLCCLRQDRLLASDGLLREN